MLPLEKNRGVLAERLRIEGEQHRQDRRSAALRALADTDTYHWSIVQQMEVEWGNSMLAAAAERMRSIPDMVPIFTSCSPNNDDNVTAYTNFELISSTWHSKFIPSPITPREVQRRTMGVMKAVLWHEWGHILYSVSPSSMKSIGSFIGFTSEVHQTWNLLEDQRMECLVVEAHPQLVESFINLIEDVVVPECTYLWLLIAGRVYLPNEMRAEAAKEFDDRLGHIRPGLAAEYEEYIQMYKAASDEIELVRIVYDVHEWLSYLNLSNRNYTGTVGNRGRAGGGGQTLRESARSLSDQMKVNGLSGEDPDLDNDLKRAGRMYGKSSSHLSQTPTPMTATQEGAAYRLSVGIEAALFDFVTDAAPRWESHRSGGIIDPLAFRTKRVGENDFYRALSGEQGLGLNTHVTLLCDNSDSMSSNMDALSVFMYAANLACDRLEVTTTNVLWADTPVKVWADGVEPCVFSLGGGTRPKNVLAKLEEYGNDEVANQLVFIFTDGEWGGECADLTEYRKSGRTIVHILYSFYEPREGVTPVGADDTIWINDLDQLTPALTRSMIRCLS